jgi:hypothetical protein
MTAPKPQSEIRLAMLGMIEGNAHPYSWSAIINGYNREAMIRAIGDRYPVILDYLGRQVPEEIRIKGARVTHVWTDDPGEAPKLAAAAKVPHILSHPEEAIGQVDGVLIATDDGDDHVRRAVPFMEADIPVFVDKPLATNSLDLWRFGNWEREGKVFLSSSGLRYSPEISDRRAEYAGLGQIRWISSTTGKSWERYGIHALESVYPLLGPGLDSVSMVRSGKSVVATVTHRAGTVVTIGVLPEAPGSAGVIHLYGERGHRCIALSDTYTAFRRQMVTFIDLIRSRKLPFPYSQTEELMLIIIAGTRSLNRGGEAVALDELRRELQAMTDESIDLLPQ